MPAPVISLTTSILGWRQWEYWEFQPGATNSPTSWACAGLPPGMTINTSTGKISGAATAPGVYELTDALKATNADGTGSMTITIGIESGAIQPTSGVDVFVDVVTGEVTLNGAGVTDTGDGKLKSLLATKEGDDLLLYVRFVKNGVILDLDLEKLALWVKELEPENQVVVSDQFEKQGTGTGTYYILHAKLDKAELAAALTDYEEDGGTSFLGLAEIERVEVSAWEAGPDTMRVTSRTFGLKIDRDLGEAAV